MMTLVSDPKFWGVVIATILALLSACSIERENPKNKQVELVFQFPKSPIRLLMVALFVIGGFFGVYALQLNISKIEAQEAKMQNIESALQRTISNQESIRHEVTLKMLKFDHLCLDIPIKDNFLWVMGEIKVDDQVIHSFPWGEKYQFSSDNEGIFLGFKPSKRSIIYKRRYDKTEIDVEVDISFLDEFDPKIIKRSSYKRIIYSEGKMAGDTAWVKGKVKSERVLGCEVLLGFSVYGKN